MEINKIYCEDCLKGLKRMGDNSVSITITSPPYNAGNNVRGNFYANYEDDLTEHEYFTFINSVVKELIRVTKYYVFFNFQLLKTNKITYLMLMNEFKHNIKEVLIWHKKQVQPAIQPTCLSSAFEFIIVLTKKEMAKNRTFERAFFNNREKGQLNLNIIHGNSAAVHELNTNKGGNKAIFPQYLVRWFLEKFTKEHDLVLDPFMGSGTTAVVCKQTKRNYIGFEIDENYIKITKDRLSQKPLMNYIKPFP